MLSSEQGLAAALDLNRMEWIDRWIESRCTTLRRRVLFGTGVVTSYVALYHFLWYFSLDQWFLPVGLRVAWLLVAPVRLWPYLFIGDAVALLVLRVPQAETYSWQWALISPLMLAPLMALVVVPIRSILKGRLLDPLYLVPVLVVVSAWAAVYPFVVSNGLGGPASTLYEFFSEAPLMWLGNYLGIVTLVSGVQLICNWLVGSTPRPTFWWETLCVFVLTPIFYSLSVSAGSMDVGALIAIPLAALAAPALVMTLRHGLNGATVGITSAAVATALTRSYDGIPGYIDTYSLPIDQSVAVFSSLLLVLGAALTRKVNSLRSLGVSEQKALELAQSSFSWAEHNLRERLFFMAQMQMRIDDYRKALVWKLRETGHAEAAMELNASAVTHLDWFDQHAAALYPERIERDGLFAALHSPAFGDFWAQGGEMDLHLRGAPKKLTVSLQLAAYRCICNGLALMAVPENPIFVVRARTWRGRARRGITITISSAGAKSSRTSVMNSLAELELDGRTRAFGGRYRRLGARRLSITLTECVVPAASSTTDSSGSSG